MRRFSFYLLVTLVILWTGYVWIAGFQDIAIQAARQRQGYMVTDEMIGASFFSMLLVWCLGVVPLGILALLAKPR